MANFANVTIIPNTAENRKSFDITIRLELGGKKQRTQDLFMLQKEKVRVAMSRKSSSNSAMAYEHTWWEEVVRIDFNLTKISAQLFDFLQERALVRCAAVAVHAAWTQIIKNSKVKTTRLDRVFLIHSFPWLFI